MFFKANKDVPSQEAFLNRKNELGLAWNGTTSNERVNYFFTHNNKFLVEGLKFMNSAIRYPLFKEGEMKRENTVVDGEFQHAESNPTFWLMNDMSKKLWGDLYSRKNAIGGIMSAPSVNEKEGIPMMLAMAIMRDRFFVELRTEKFNLCSKRWICNLCI